MDSSDESRQSVEGALDIPSLNAPALAPVPEIEDDLLVPTPIPMIENETFADPVQ